MGSITRTKRKTVDVTVRLEDGQWVVGFSVLRERRRRQEPNLNPSDAAVGVVKWFHGLRHEQVVSVTHVRTDPGDTKVYRVKFDHIIDEFEI